MTGLVAVVNVVKVAGFGGCRECSESDRFCGCGQREGKEKKKRKEKKIGMEV